MYCCSRLLWLQGLLPSSNSGFGLPLPSLSGAEEEILETSDFFAEMQGLLADELGAKDGEEGLADILLEHFTD